MKKLTVNLAPSYDIIIGQNLLKQANKYINPVIPQDRVIIITDENVAPLYLNTLTSSLGNIQHNFIILPAGEQTKQFIHFEKLLDDILALKPDRKTTLIALGGGVIGDITGFAASVILRGIPFIQIPTTLLSQVDSSVGGKTGINSKYGKNLIGSFYQPLLVLTDTTVLNTLDGRQLKAGYAEVIKYGLIKDMPFFNWLDENVDKIMAREAEALSQAIYRSCEIKAEIVAEDEKEAGVRALLNLGHTFGHALELETGYGDKLLHGEAVAIGTIMAGKFSHDKGLLSQAELDRIYNHFTKAGLPVKLSYELDKNKLVSHMKQDKKSIAEKIKLVLLNGIGSSYIENNVDEEILDCFFTDINS